MEEATEDNWFVGILFWHSHFQMHTSHLEGEARL